MGPDLPTHLTRADQPDNLFRLSKIEQGRLAPDMRASYWTQYPLRCAADNLTR